MMGKVGLKNFDIDRRYNAEKMGIIVYSVYDNRILKSGLWRSRKWNSRL